MSNLVDSNKYCNSVFFPSFSQVAQVETIWLFCLYYIASLFNPCGNLKLTHFTHHAANQWAGSYF